MLSHTASVIGRPSFAASRASTVFSEVVSDEQRVEELTNVELTRAVKNAQTVNRQIFLENEIFEKYLKRTDPTLLLGFDKLLEQVGAAVNAQNRVHAIASSMLHPMSSALSLTNLSRRGTETSLESQFALPTLMPGNKSYSVMKFGTSSLLDRGGQRLQTNHKFEMVGREMEELRIEFDRFKKLCTRKRADLHAEIEELCMMIAEVKDSDEELTRNIIVGAVNELTHTIPAEKFIRHMEEWFKRADCMMGKLRLKTSTLRSWNLRLQTQLVAKLELGETLRPVDFDYMQIENNEQAKKIDQKNKHLIELKRMTGKCNLQLVIARDHLSRELKKLTAVEESITSKYALIETLRDETQLVDVQVEKADKELQKVKYRRTHFTVPPVLEYARKKDELANLRKDFKVWTRRFNVQHTSLVACVRALQRVAPYTINPNAYLRKKTEPSTGETDISRSTSVSPQQSSIEHVRTKKDSIKRTSHTPVPVKVGYPFIFDVGIKNSKGEIRRMSEYLHGDIRRKSGSLHGVLMKPSYDRFKLE